MPWKVATNTKGCPIITEQPSCIGSLTIPAYFTAICLAGFTLASSFLGMFTLSMPFLWEADIFSESTVSGRLKERQKLS
jgi:hypothetical protein